MRRFGTLSAARPARSTRPSRVVLHVGAPLAGTTFLRETLTRNRRRLTRFGVLYPAGHLGGEAGPRDAVLDVLDLAAPGEHVSTGAWERLAQAARDWRRGTVVISHELLADADEDQVSRIVAGFGSAQVEVVYVARDLARQLPLAWQEWVRNGGTASFAGYVDRVARHDDHRLARVFWRSHDVAGVLGRWGACVAPEHVHVVTMPSGPDQDQVLWQRFARVVGVEPARLRAGADGARRLDALAATEAARLLNAAGRGGLPVGLLAGVEGPVPALDEAHAGWLADEAERAVAAVKDGGYDVVGDVTELRAGPDGWATEPGAVHPADADVVRAQTRLLAALLDR
jgi:hypothetical protein